MVEVKDPLKYIEELEEMFATPGWRNLIDEAREQLNQYKDEALTLPTWERVCETRGQALQLARLLNLPDMIAMMRSNLEAEDADEYADL